MAFPCLPITAKGRRGDYGEAVALAAAAGAIRQIVLPTSSAISTPPVRSTATPATNSVSVVFGIRDACVSRLTPRNRLERRYVPWELHAFTLDRPFCFPRIRLICAPPREGRAHAPDSHHTDRHHRVWRGPKLSAWLQVRRGRLVRLRYGPDCRGPNAGDHRNAPSGRTGTSAGAGSAAAIS